MKSFYKESDKMFDVICDEYHLLQMMSRFGISLGFGEKSVREVCLTNGVDPETFLAVANYLRFGSQTASSLQAQVSVKALMQYLRNAHTYYLNLKLPDIRQRLISAIDCSQSNEVAYLVLKYYDEYMHDVRRHMEYENKKVFPYVEFLLTGEKLSSAITSIAQFKKSHQGIHHKLHELKSLIIKYYSAADAFVMLQNVLVDLFATEADLHQHCAVEDDLFVPAVELLEKKVEAGEAVPDSVNDSLSEDTLSQREIEILTLIVRGVSTKEIADKLYISSNTVMTHRKNIFRKLDIHTVNGLTIYAIVNNLVKLDEVKL